MVHGLIATSAMKGWSKTGIRNLDHFPGSNFRFTIRSPAICAVVVLTPTSHT